MEPIHAENTTNTSIPEFVRPFDHVGIIIIATIIIFFLVACLIMDSVTMAVIHTTPSLRKDKFMIMIFSLCCSDLISTLISWIWLHRRTWGFDDFKPIPEFFCKLYWGGDYMTNFVTALHIFIFACLRLTAIKFPAAFRRLQRRTLRIGIITVWLICFGCAFIPQLLWFNARKRDRASDQPDARWPACTLNPEYLKEYQLWLQVLYPILLYVPVIGVVVVSLVITVIVYLHLYSSKFKQNAKRKRKDRQAIIQLLLISVCFIIGYIPTTAYDLWSVQSWPNTRYYHKFDYWFGTVAYICIRFSETMNPIFYNLGSPKMRACTLTFLKRTFGTKSFELGTATQSPKQTRSSSAVSTKT